MSTLIEVRTSDGVVGRCDAKCYDAKHPDCRCICSGMNHGQGIDKASDNVREAFEEMVNNYVANNDLADYEATININVVNQMRLPLHMPIHDRLTKARKDANI